MNYREYIEQEVASIRLSELDNGATVIVRTPGTPGVVSIGCFLKMGSLYEDDRSAGLSNLLQALMLKGTRRLDSSLLARELESLGARTASSSGKELGRTSMVTIVEHLGPALELFLEILTEPAFDSQEFEKERQIAIEEIKRDRDQFLSRAFTLFQESFYGGHPFRKHVLGSEETIGDVTLDDVRRVYRKFYVPSNMVFSIVGDVDIEWIVEAIRKYTANMDRGLPPRDLAGTERVESNEKNTEYRNSEAAWIVTGFPAPSLGDGKQPACQVLSAILGGSMSSRLFIELREKKALAYQVSSTYNTYVGPSFIAGYLGTSPGRAEEAQAALVEEMTGLASGDVSREEVDSSINYLVGSYMINSELSTALTRRYGRFQALGVGYDFGRRYLAALAEVRPEDVVDIAREFLTRPVTGSVLPKELKVNS